MKVKNINFLNLDTLYNIVVDKFYDEDYKDVKFGRNLPQLLNHIVISLDLTEVSQYEYIFLKMYGSSITELTTQVYNLKYVENNYKEIYDNICKFIPLMCSISENDKDNSIDFSAYLCPSGIITGDCTLTFYGSELINITTLDPRDFFIMASNYKCIIKNEDPSKNKLDPEYVKELYNDENVKNFIISTFIQNFYKFMTDKVSYIDLASDSFNYTKFLSLSQENSIKFLNIRNPYFMCDFIEDESSTIMDTLDRYKKSMISHDFSIKNTNFEICINSDFGVFFEFMNLLPYEKFSTLESFNIPASKSIDKENIPNCPEEIRGQFENRYNGRMNNLVDNIKSSYESNIIQKLELTQNYIPYSYIILLSLSDIDKYLNSYLNKNKNSDDYIVIRTMEIIKKIITFSMAIYKKL